MSLLRVFIGFDSRQPVAFNVAQASIWRHCSRPVSITPLVLSTLPIQRKGLTEFSVSRYLVPWLCNYEGHALFLDGDTLCMGDIAQLPWGSEHPVSVVKHDTVVKAGREVDVHFERPSVMLFNCAKCAALTPDFVQTGKPHNLQWAESVGELPREWNYLVGYDTNNFEKCEDEGCPQHGTDHDCRRRIKLAHFTMGLPCFEETAKDEYADQWRETAAWSGSTCSWADIMGGSVHAKWKQAPPVKQFMRIQGFR